MRTALDRVESLLGSIEGFTLSQVRNKILPMFGFFQPPSEEEQQQMKEAFERHRMSIEEFQHSFQRLFEELNEDQLKTLRTAFHAILDVSGAPLSAQWESMCAWELKKRFNICVTCGINHDTELLEEKEPVAPPAPKEDATREPLEVLENPDALPPFHELTKKERELAYLYHVDDLRDAETGELLGFYCTGINGMSEPCGVKYPSLEDRMLRGPESCSGCFQRMAHG